MKKHIIAAAVAAAVAVPAVAQNVTVYGIIDTNIQYYDDGINSYVRSQNGALATSRLGFRGTEDLGGGLKAEFNLETRVNPSDGTYTQTAALTNFARNSGNYTGSIANSIFNREAWVGLSGAFGAVRMGTSDVTDATNIDSKVSFAGDLGLTTAEFDADLKNVVRYTTPNMNGFQVQIGYSSSGADAKTNEVKSIYGEYVQGPLGVYLSRSELAASTTQTDVDTKFGLKYDFGSFAAGITVASRNNDGQNDYKRTVANVAIPVGNGVTLHGVIKSYNVDNSSNDDADTTILAVTKALSKRTTAYAAYTRVDNGGTTADTTSTAVGIRHNF